MAQHTVLYRNPTVAAAASFASLPIVPYTGDNVGNNQFLPPIPLELVFAAAFGATLSAARIQTPLLAATALDWIRPFNLSATVPTDYNLCDYRPKSVKFNTYENINVQTSNSAGGATDDQFVILHFGDGNYAMPTGKYLKMRLLGSTTVVADAWNSVTLVPDESLPTARFAIIGLEVVGATGICARLDIPGWAPGGKIMHPGCVPLPTIGLKQPVPLYNFPFGNIGEFTNQTIPRLDYYSNAADTAQQVWLDIVQLTNISAM